MKLLYAAIAMLLTAFSAHADMDSGASGHYCGWTQSDYEIASPLCGLSGDSQRGRKLATDSLGGNCIACHELPLQAEAHGDIGPPLRGVASRLSEGHIRLRMVNSHLFSPMTIMPAYYKDPRQINRPGKEYLGKTFLTAQQIEDVIAWLMTLK
jgi:L-cysteine S-thiosulfotransferase